MTAVNGERLLRDLVDIPTSVQKSDFVISLAQGIDDPARTVADYVVTEQLVTCFDQALSLVASAIADGRSKGAYLHGSFGSGKSHFMAVLHLLLRHNAAARAIPELAPALARHDAQLQGKQVLLVPYHFIGEQSMESGVLGGYVRHIRRLHPDKPLPAVFADDKLFDDAESLRARIGDEAFFAELGGAAEQLAGFGDLAGGWDAAAFDRARAAPPDDEDRRRLAADLVAGFFTSYAELAAGSGQGYVPLDEGLSAISRHARELGYDAVVLFLDELILWLATRMADADFVAREGSKVGLLVEGSAPRPIPLVSLVARQRDLKDFIGDAVPGAQRAGFSHGVQWWEGRFATISLADRNLTAIVERRLLRPKSESARSEIDSAFQAVTARAERAVGTLMTDEGDREAFRRVYPFSPALIEVLVGVSGFLQRERTALRLLLQLLVERRDELTVGQLVPLGDLWDVIDAGEEPFDDALRRHFAKARRLYAAKLRPLLLDTHSVSEEAVERLDRRHAFFADDRLIKTLLLAALVPEVRPVRGLTVRRLADLNHGTIRSPIPGQERANVLTKVRRWASQVGELRVDGDDQDPSVSLQLVGVDTDSILDQASAHDTTGARIRMVRNLLGDAIGLDTREALLPAFTFPWRGRNRQVDIAFANVRDPRDLPDGEFRATADRPKVVIDYPFDPEDRGPADDIARAQRLRDTIGPTPTLCWIPRSLSEKARRELGQLVILDFLLTGDRLDQHTAHLPQAQRLEARDVLTGRREQLKAYLVEVLRQAYGVSAPDADSVRDDVALADQFPTLDGSITVRPPTAASLRDAFGQLLDQLWSAVAPAHPQFPETIRKPELVRTLDLVAQAAARPDRRLEVNTGDRPLLRKVIAPLRLGQIGEAHFTLDRHWRDHFHRMQQANPGPVTVARLREWMDEPTRMALDEPVANLVISAYAIEDDRVLVVDGMTLPPTVDRLDGRVELRTQELPDEGVWATATGRAPRLFGVASSPLRSAATVAALARDVRAAAEPHRDGVRRLVPALNRLADRFGVPADAPRRRNAVAAQTLVDGVTTAADDLAVVRFVAGVDVPTTAEALGASIKQAGRVAAALDAAMTDLFDVAFALGPPWDAEAAVIRDRLVQAVAADQFTVDLVEVLTSVARDATALVGRATRQPAAPQVPAPGGPVTPSAAETGPASPIPSAPSPALPAAGDQSGLSGEEARRLLEQLLAAGALRRLDVRWELEA